VRLAGNLQEGRRHTELDRHQDELDWRAAVVLADVQVAGRRESPESCALRHDCANIGGEVRSSTFFCDDISPIRVSWYGPPGSRALAECQGAVATCTVPGEAADPWATCDATSDIEPVYGGWASLCEFRTADGSIAGKGQCESVIHLTEGRDQ
jgi:hypothetical protein